MSQQWTPGCQNETCYMCGHSHPIMAHWSSNGETRALCHADDHSCYTDHNRMDALRLDQINRDRAEGQKYGTVWIDVLPDITQFREAIDGLRKEHEKARKRIQQILALANRRKPLIHKGGKP